MSQAMLAGKVAIVTGFTGSIGRAIATRLAEDGARVIGCGRRQEAGDSAAASLREKGLDISFIAADVGSEAAVGEMVAAAAERFGSVDIVVNNAAAVDVVRAGKETNVVALPTETFQYELLINLFAPFWFFKHAIPLMKASGGGAFVNCSTVSAHRKQPGMPAYAASKAALEALSEQVAVEYGRDNIRSNCIVIGAIRNEVNKAFHEHPRGGPMFRSAQSLDTLGLPEFIADAALFLGSDRSRFTTGSNLMVEGGADIKSGFPDATVLYREMNADPASATHTG